MKSLFLVGYMGCGKSTIGRKLARRLEVAFADTDTLVEAQEGASVTDVFRYEGEESFRVLERAALEKALMMGDGVVVSTGGGLPIWEDNMARMNLAGITIYLRRTPEQIARRLSPYGRQKRPKLRGLNDEELIAFMTANMSEREPYYAQAKLIVDCADASDEEVIERIVKQIEQ